MSERERRRDLDRIKRLEDAVLQLAQRPVPGHDFHRVKFPPSGGPIAEIYKAHRRRRITP